MSYARVLRQFFIFKLVVCECVINEKLQQRVTDVTDALDWSRPDLFQKHTRRENCRYCVTN